MIDGLLPGEGAPQPRVNVGEDVELQVLHLFKVSKANEIIDSLNDLAALIKISGEEKMELLTDYNIFDLLYQWFMEKKITVKKVIISFLLTVIDSMFVIPDVLQTIICFSLDSFPQCLEMKSSFYILFTKLCLKSPSSHQFFIDHMNAKLIAFVCSFDSQESERNKDILLAFISSIFHYQVSEDFARLFISIVVESPIKDELIVSIVASFPDAISIIGSEQTSFSAMKLVANNQISNRALLSLAISAEACNPQIIPQLIKLSLTQIEYSSLALFALAEMAKNNDFAASAIYSQFNSLMYVNMPGLIMREATKIVLQLMKILPRSSSELLYSVESAKLLLESLIFDDQDLRTQIVKALFQIDKEIVVSQINSQTKDVIDEVIDEGCYEACHLLEE